MMELTDNVNMLTLQFAICAKSMKLFELSLKEKAKYFRLSYFIVRSMSTKC